MDTSNPIHPGFAKAQSFISHLPPAVSNLLSYAPIQKTLAIATAIPLLISLNRYSTRRAQNSWTRPRPWDASKELVLLTGGSSGIGKQILYDLAELNVKVIVFDIQKSTPHIIPEVFALSDPYYTTHVTITDMLSRRSGLPRHDMVVMQNITAKEILQRMRYLPLTTELRTEFQYSNLMYITAAYLIEIVTEQSFESFCERESLGCAGNARHEFRPPPRKGAREGLSRRGIFFSEVDNITTVSTDQVYNPAVTGAGNILTSVSDYNKLD
ncbi:beta-lactamase/transpeptidase-like protein [Aspergillus crustosus]